eukprot:scaffold886_cov174-Ochromonas_danica.AAC.31
MLVLVVSSFAEDKLGKHSYRFFLRALKRLISRGGDAFDDCHYRERRLDELADLVVNWEFDRLDKKAQENSAAFDKIDVIVVCGDLSCLPWEPRAAQVVSLVHMAKTTNKPFLGVGFGALVAVYSLATKGVPFHVLNAPTGQSLEELPAFDTFSLGTGGYPSGWLHKETGDIYTYHPRTREWKPT